MLNPKHNEMVAKSDNVYLAGKLILVVLMQTFHWRQLAGESYCTSSSGIHPVGSDS